MRFYILLFVSILVSNCGMDYDGKKFHKEKDDRVKAEIELSEEQSRNRFIAGLTKNFVQTTTLQWLYTKSSGLPVETLAKAETLCQELGFDLASLSQLKGEGLSIAAIKKINDADANALDKLFYTKDGSYSEDAIGLVACVRSIPK